MLPETRPRPSSLGTGGKLTYSINMRRSSKYMKTKGLGLHFFGYFLGRVLFVFIPFYHHFGAQTELFIPFLVNKADISAYHFQGTF